MPRYKLTIEYDGTNFSGWQIQPDTKTVEEEIEKAFSKILQQPVDIFGQGRTDAGVHAKGQVAHVDLPNTIKPDKIVLGVNGLIGKEIHIHTIEEVDSEFHARFDAKYREYEYTVLKNESPLNNRIAWFPYNSLETEKLKECAELLNGEFDFSGFSKYNEENYTTLCTILLSGWEINNDYMVYKIRANRFLRNMVRRIVGTMAEVAKGKIEVKDFKKALINPTSGIKTFTAPAKGLILSKVFYKK